MAETYTGVTPAQVGEEYDLALGYDPGSGTTAFVGYSLKSGTEWVETPNLEDEQRLVTIASPNTSDRYSFYPKITQSDWSGGEGQMFYQDPTRYYQSFQVDVTKPGYLQLTPGTPLNTHFVINYALSALSFDRAPFANNGYRPVLAANIGGVASVVSWDGHIFNMTGLDGEIYHAIEGPSGGYFFGASGSTGPGIWQLTSSQVNGLTIGAGTSSITPTQWTSDTTPPGATQAFAYLSSPAGTGALYYIAFTTNLAGASTNSIIRINKAVSSGETRVQILVGNTMELPINFLGSTAAGLIFATQDSQALSAWTVLPCYIYTFDGQTTTRILDFQGKVYASYEMNGVTYLLLYMQQNNTVSPQMVLMAYANGTLTTIFDGRYAFPDFQASGQDYYGNWSGSLQGDGRFLYIGWPGFYAWAYDTVRQAFVRVGSAAPLTPNNLSHRVLPTTFGLVDAQLYLGGASGHTLNVDFNRTVPATGYLVTSWFDAGTPGIVKSYRCVEVEMQQAVPAGASVQVAFRTDQSQAFTTLTNSFRLPNGNLMFYLPSRTLAYRIQLRFTLNAGTADTSPVIRDYALTLNPGRTWKLTLACSRGQSKRNGQPDDQGDATVLLANVLAAYGQGGYVTMLVPDPTNAPGSTVTVNGTAVTQPYVSLTTARIEQYTWHAVVSPAYRTDVDGNGYAAEGELDVVLAEQL